LLICGAKAAIRFQLIPKLALGEIAFGNRRALLWPCDIGYEPKILTGGNILAFVVTPVSDGIDPFDV
jgi:hypothetical protein